MKALISILFFVCSVPVTAAPFRFNLLTEPQGLDPQTTSAASGNYLMHNLYRGLFFWDSAKGLRAEGARECKREKSEMVCLLNPLKWSDGSRIKASDYVRSFRRLIDPAKRSPQADVLFSLENARAIWAGQMPPEKLGVEAVGELTLRIRFAESDPEFEYKLIHPALTPEPPGGFRRREEATRAVVNGPYRLSEWRTGKFTRLEPNQNYGSGANKRPTLEAYFIEDDATALRLFEAGKLDFLRRLTATEIPRFRGKPGFFQFPMARFDYIGFGPRLRTNKALRDAIVARTDFKSFLKVFDTISPPGCPSLPRAMMDQVFCQQSHLSAATKPKLSAPEKLEFGFSRMGGDDIARAAEWFQGQWKRNLQLEVQLKSEEQGVYLQRLRTNPPDIFRKGVSLDRPTCLAALEIFTRGHPENYIRYEDAEFAKKLEMLHDARTPEERKRACSQAVRHLLESHRLIPLGEMFFTILVNPKYSGWSLNELNQLDLTNLTGPE